ncbi:hypothetical protein FACS189418_6950 [Clostridia bacterium]|nr:hypothetical protein FACS189418_6950 [Clostridia bacterium]
MLARKILQFNDLVIDGFEMIQKQSLSGSFKANPIEYSFSHGSTPPFFASSLYAKEQSLSMTLRIDKRKLRRDNQLFYKDWIYRNLSKPGRLWAIEGKQILWAFAYVRDFSEAYDDHRYFIELSVEFVLYEGIWHKTDSRKTYLTPYEACDWDACLDYREEQFCLPCCLGCGKVNPIRSCCDCHCAALKKENSLCVVGNHAINLFHDSCANRYQLHYDCRAKEKFFPNDHDVKICKDGLRASVIAGTFYSSTTLPTKKVSVVLDGEFTDPTIRINGNQIKLDGGLFQGLIRINASMELWYHYINPEEPCNCLEDWNMLDFERIIFPDYSEFGFTIYPGANTLLIEGMDCCSMNCVYLDIDEITL